jgi:transcriptional regulator with XRE-family HTH domain
LPFPIEDSSMKKSIHTKEYAYFVERLRNARKEIGLTQAHVAKKLKRPQSYVSRVEVGEQRWDILELKIFADLCGKDINYFL